MARAGETITNPVTGLTITWVTVEPGLLEWEDDYPRQGLRVAPHVHPGMEERWHVVDGSVRFRVGDEERVLGPGEEIAAAPGVTHGAWNVTEGARMRVSMTPALRWAEVVEQLFAWARDGRTDQNGTPELELLIRLMRDYSAEIAPPYRLPSAADQRVLEDDGERQSADRHR
jgi:mannose-6-phosphate isomerase-like protein (cupin superfamily)